MEVRNRFKGLDLIDRVPDELWNEDCDIVQETGIKTIPTENKCKKAKWLSEEALRITVTVRVTNSCEKNRSEKQRRKGKIQASECRVPKNSKKEIRKPSSEINAKKYMKTTEWERVEISSRKLETPRGYFMQRWA